MTLPIRNVLERKWKSTDIVICCLGEFGYKLRQQWESVGSWGYDPARNDEGASRMKFGMRVRGGLFAALIMFAVPVLTTPAAMLVPSPAVAQTVNTIEVVGNRRVEIETIRSYFKVGPGGRLDRAAIDDGLKALIETGLFQDVRINPVGGATAANARSRRDSDTPIDRQRHTTSPISVASAAPSRPPTATRAAPSATYSGSPPSTAPAV